jgi:hypothetical protein
MAHEDVERVNREIVLALYDAGEVAPSSTTLQGRYAIRAAIVNHRTGEGEIATLVAAVLKAGRHLSTHPSTPSTGSHAPHDRFNPD